MFYFIAWSATRPGIDQETWRKFCGARVGIDLDQNIANPHAREQLLQDRQAMKLGDFTGIGGIPDQDIAMWETMGAIADRSQERLGASDVAMVQFRRLMVNAARRFRDGEPGDRYERAADPAGQDPLLRRDRGESDGLADARAQRRGADAVGQDGGGRSNFLIDVVGCMNEGLTQKRRILAGTCAFLA